MVEWVRQTVRNVSDLLVFANQTVIPPLSEEADAVVKPCTYFYTSKAHAHPQTGTCILNYFH